MSRPASRAHRASGALAALAALLLTGCAGGRMLRMTPFADDALPDADRVNLWPLYYASDDAVVVLWPIFDHDDEGFALRPLVSHEGSEWSILYPLAGWDTERDRWWALPAYSLPRNRGVFPLWNFGEWNHFLLAYWFDDQAGENAGWGVVPFYGQGEFNFAGPVWWTKPRAPDVEPAWGLFPVASIAEHEGYVVPAYWKTNDDGEFEVLTTFPLFHYENDGDAKHLITPLGGRGWSADGEDRFVNVLGPVYHRASDGEGYSYTAVAWPIFRVERDGEVSDLHVFPFLHRHADPDGSRTSSLLGLVQREKTPAGSGLRAAPLFSYTRGLTPGFLDYLTVLGYHASDDDAEVPSRSFHVGTPALFHHRRADDDVSWGGLLELIDYEAQGDESSFRLLYYLYRSERRGDEVRRDLFPFLTWDSGPEATEVSFLWRLFRYERDGARRGGHVLFVPWGDA